MESEQLLFDDGEHKCIAFHFDDETMQESFLALNQYLIIHNNKAILLDPGSKDMFDILADAISRYINIENLEYIFLSHQDPDVADSIAQWMIATPAKVVISSVWMRFITHYGLLDMSRILPFSDEGGTIKLGDSLLEVIPAHFLHSSGNFSLYDTYAKTLFSGDIGASVSPLYGDSTQDFESLKPYMQDFHERYMAGNIFCRAWVKNVRKLDINMIAPQHGNVLDEDSSAKFLDWFEELRCGGDLVEKLYGQA